MGLFYWFDDAFAFLNFLSIQLSVHFLTHGMGNWLCRAALLLRFALKADGCCVSVTVPKPASNTETDTLAAHQNMHEWNQTILPCSA